MAGSVSAMSCAEGCTVGVFAASAVPAPACVLRAVRSQLRVEYERPAESYEPLEFLYVVMPGALCGVTESRSDCLRAGAELTREANDFVSDDPSHHSVPSYMWASRSA